MEGNHILGVHADHRLNPSYELMKEAGIEWLRVGFSYPYKDRVHGELTRQFYETIERIKSLRSKGFRVMGVTPLAGSYSYNKTLDKTLWQPGIPEWAGTIDQDKYYEAYKEGCKEISRQTAELVEIWQVSNEMDIKIFRGSMTVEQAARFLKAGTQGIKQGNPEARTSINPAALGQDGRWLFTTLYSRNEGLFDYAGIDGYFGSWAPGGPRNWAPLIEEIHRITDTPVLVHEWGYSSIGQVEERPQGPPPKGWNSWNCAEKAWFNVWKRAHSEQEQAEYVKTTLEIFVKTPNLAGNFFFRWRDPPTCWQCGQPHCPSECGWGLIDKEGKLKSAYHSFKQTFEELYR